MSKVNKLSSSIIKSAYSKYFTQKKITIIIDGKNYEVLIDEKFKAGKIAKLVVEALTNYEKLKDNDELQLTYIMFLVIKYFSDIDMVKECDFEDQLKVLNAMIDLDIMKNILDSFDKEQMDRVADYFKRFSENINEVVDMKELESIIESEEIEIETGENNEGC